MFQSLLLRSLAYSSENFLKKACAAWLAALLAAGKARVNSLRANSPTFWIARFLTPPSRPFLQRVRRPIEITRRGPSFSSDGGSRAHPPFDGKISIELWGP